MGDLLGRIFAVFGTTAGLTVLALAGLALAGLLVFVFWDTLRLPRRDDASNQALKTAPPPLLAPEIVSRRADQDLPGDRPRIVRAAVLLTLVGLFGFGAVQLWEAPKPTEQLPQIALEHASALRSTGTNDAVRYTVGADPSIFSAYCETSGSLAERRVQICERGAAVRLDMLRFARADRFVVNPVWEVKAPTFVRSESHAVPFDFSGDVTFSAPPTVQDAAYDGYLVVGVSEPGDRPTAAARAEALRDFALRQLSGGDRADCTRSERVFTALASRIETGAENKEPLAPMVIGITSDPASSTPVEDMRSAAERFLKTYGTDLMVTDVNLIEGVRACTRGEGVR